MDLDRQPLPGVPAKETPVFLTWRLHDSLPSGRVFSLDRMSPGQAFVAMDRELHGSRAGSSYLRRPELADLVVRAILYNGGVLGHYVWHAFVIMPNHVHLLLTPCVPLSRLIASLKGITAGQANAVLGLEGKLFWQEDSYHRPMRNGEEFERIREFIEEHPVHAGLVAHAGEYRWSSAAGRRSARALPLPPPLETHLEYAS